MEEKYSKVCEIAEHLTSLSTNKRPDCEEILNTINSCAIDMKEIKDSVVQMFLSSNDFENDFLRHFLVTKLENYKTNETND